MSCCTDKAIRRGRVDHLHDQGPNYYKKYQTYLLQGAPTVSHSDKSTDLGAQKHSSAAASLGVREEATHYTGTSLSVAMREAIKTRSDQGTTHASWGFRQNDRKKKKFQLQAQSG